MTATRSSLSPDTAEVAITVGDTTTLASLADRLTAVRGIWLNGSVTVEDLRAAVQLPALVELQVRAALTREMLEVLAGRPFERLLLSSFEATALDALAGIQARDLALAVTGEGSAWGTVLGLPLDKLHLKLARTEIPTAAIEAIARTGTMRWLSTVEASFPAAAIEALGAAHSLELVSLSTFGAPGRVRIAGNRGLRELELLTTNIDALELESLPSLQHAELQHTTAISVRDLPKLSVLRVEAMGRSVAVSVDGLPALEQITSLTTDLGALTITGAPRLHRIDARGVTNADVLAAAATLAPEVIVETPRGKAKKVGEKRKVKWSSPKLGLDAAPRAALIAGRLAEGPYSSGRAKDLATVGEWWAQQLGVHVAGAVPQMLDPEDGAWGLVFGRVLALVDADRGEATVELSPSVLAEAERALADTWAEVAGVLADDRLLTRPFGLYLVACGAGAFVAGERVRLEKRWHAALSVDGATLASVDGFSLPWRRVEVSPGTTVRLAMKPGPAV